MLYKVTPMMPSPEAEKPKKVREPGQPRKRRKTAIYDADGHEVLITLMCLKCKSMRPLANFGLRKMADGAIRNQPWCRTCRGGAGTKKKTPHGDELSSVPAEAEAPLDAESAEVPVSGEVELPAHDSGSEGASLLMAEEPTHPGSEPLLHAPPPDDAHAPSQG